MPSAVTTELETTASKLALIPEFLRDERGLVNRETESRVTLIALAAKLHIMLYGAPGVAKSMTVDNVLKHIPSVSQFKTQAYKASPPEQFLGPISIKAMERDEFVRIVKGRAADSEVVFVDELTRAPRALLPAFQGMMVEREFDSGNGAQHVPLMTMIGAVNHLLEDDTELAAFLDRFALKLIVQPPASIDQFTTIMRGALDRRSNPAVQIPPELMVTRVELLNFQDHVDTIRVGDDVLDTLGELWSNLMAQGVMPSIRRYTDVVKAMQAQAAIEGRDEVLTDDIQLAQQSLWTAEDEAKTVYTEVIKFASEWVKQSAALTDAFAETVDRLGTVQSLVASGTTVSTQVEVAEKTASVRDHGLNILDETKTLREQIERQAADAQGRDTSDLDAMVTQIGAARKWISTNLLGGLEL